MKDEDLVLECVKKFPVWKGFWARTIIKNLVTGNLRFSDKSEHNFNVGCDMGQIDPNVYQIACTREQHIRKRIELYKPVKVSQMHFVFSGVVIPRPTHEEMIYIAEIDSKNSLSSIHENGLGEIECGDFRFGNDPVDDVDFEIREWKPEIGQKALLLNEQDYHIEYGDIAIGKEVTVRALFMSAGSIEMAAIEYDGANYCFRSNMLHPPKTEAEKGRERLIKEANKTAREAIYTLPYTALDSEAVSVIEALVDAGWKPKND